MDEPDALLRRRPGGRFRRERPEGESGGARGIDPRDGSRDARGVRGGRLVTAAAGRDEEDASLGGEAERPARVGARDRRVRDRDGRHGDRPAPQRALDRIGIAGEDREIEPLEAVRERGLGEARLRHVTAHERAAGVAEVDAGELAMRSEGEGVNGDEVGGERAHQSFEGAGDEAASLRVGEAGALGDGGGGELDDDGAGGLEEGICLRGGREHRPHVCGRERLGDRDHAGDVPRGEPVVGDEQDAQRARIAHETS